MFPAVELLCGLWQVLHLLLVSLIHSLRKVIQAGPAHPDCSTPCWKSGLWVAPPKEGELHVEINFLSAVGGTCDNSLLSTASCIHIRVINEIGSRGRETGFPQEGARAQLRWLRRGWRAVQESPSSVPPSKCSRVWTIANEALTCHRWGVDSSFSQTLGAVSQGGHGVSRCRVSVEMSTGVGTRRAWIGRRRTHLLWISLAVQNNGGRRSSSPL